MLLHYGFVEVFGVEAYTQSTMRLVGIGEGRYPFSMPGDRGYDTLDDHIIKGTLDLFPLLKVPSTRHAGQG